MNEKTFKSEGQELDKLAQRLFAKCSDPRDTLKLSIILEKVWESMRKAKTDLCDLL
jgi:hypothetical protein